jgi:hypothetical protein
MLKVCEAVLLSVAPVGTVLWPFAGKSGALSSIVKDLAVQKSRKHGNRLSIGY